MLILAAMGVVVTAAVVQGCGSGGTTDLTTKRSQACQHFLGCQGTADAQTVCAPGGSTYTGSGSSAAGVAGDNYAKMSEACVDCIIVADCQKLLTGTPCQAQCNGP